MSPERRKELVQRREQLKEQRRRQSLESQQRNFLAPLDDASVIYSLVDDEPLIEWITNRFSVDQSSSIDWHDVKQWRCVAPNASALREALMGLAKEEGFGDPCVAIVYADSALPSLKMQYSELSRHANIIVDFNWQTWVFDPASDWIIEFHHDLGWRWGKAAYPNAATERPRGEESKATKKVRPDRAGQ